MVHVECRTLDALNELWERWSEDNDRSPEHSVCCREDLETVMRRDETGRSWDHVCKKCGASMVAEMTASQINYTLVYDRGAAS